MKSIILLTTITCFLTTTESYSQTITLSLRNVSLEKTFREITKQSGFGFLYTREQINKSNPVTVNIKKASITEALDNCFANQPLSFIIEDKYVIVKDKLKETSSPSPKETLTITGKVINEQNEPVAGATVTVEHSNVAMATDGEGKFAFRDLKVDDVLYITSIGYRPIEMPLGERTDLVVKLQTAVATLDETIIKGYYSTTRRLNTGSVSKISSEEISSQPVSNPLAALQGLVPGLLVSQKNGLPGSNFMVRIRGRNSIQSGNSPLYIIDGVPFLNDEDVLIQNSSLNANSPFNTLDPAEIESIEVLKDADATAIYGSRGANGVILITTKEGKSGKTSLDVNLDHGWGKVTRTIQFMNTAQYLEMRHEALQNDGVVPNVSNAYDFLVWDSTRYTDLKKLLIGNTADITNVSLRLNGGNQFTRFNIGSNYYKETTVFPGKKAEQRAAFDFHLNHNTANNKLNFTISASFANNNSDLITQDLTQFINLPPVIPALHDSVGNLKWSQAGFSFNNPLASLLRTKKVITDRLTASSSVEYKLLTHLKLKLNLGYNMLDVDQSNKIPIRSQNPALNPLGSAFFGKNQVKSWIIEPQIEYHKVLFPKSNVEIQLGSTLQENSDKSTSISATGYINDNLLNSTSGAQSIHSLVGSQLYHYGAIFGRFSYNWSEKYIINVTGRRDGSSRFGPGKQFANFGAMGAAWIFSTENYFRNHFQFMSFGKIRGSYGTTGNDLIGNYNYLDLYAETLYPYQDQSSLFPVKLFNSDYSWEVIRKLDVALDLGLFNKRLMVTTEWFKNRSTNQIIDYSLPSQTGFTYVLQNFPGVVQNSGVELSLTTDNIKSKNLKWTTTFNITSEKNKLANFPGLKTSSYADRYIVGKPLNIYIGAKYLGVDPLTGIYQYLGKDKNPVSFPTSKDYTYLGTTDPEFYGGFQNNFSYRGLVISMLFEFRKQMGIDPVFGDLNIVGMPTNQPVAVLDRWRNPGDHSRYERYTQTLTGAATSSFYIFNSSAKLTDASFCRLKNLSISYSFPPEWLKKLKLQKFKLYLQGQNLFVITEYNGADPEIQSLCQLPPLKRLVTGVQIIL